VFVSLTPNTYLLPPWSRAILEKLTGSQPVKKLSAFYGTRRFITAFTSASHLSLPYSHYGCSICPVYELYPTVPISSQPGQRLSSDSSRSSSVYTVNLKKMKSDRRSSYRHFQLIIDQSSYYLTLYT